MNLSIRPYENSDLERVIQIWLRAWESSRLPVRNPLDAEKLRSSIPVEIKRGVLIYVVVVNTFVLGVVILRGAKLEQLYVDPNYQRKGIGRKLIEFTKQMRATGFWL